MTQQHLVGEEHGETVDAQPPAAGRGQTVLHRRAKLLVVNLREATWGGQTNNNKQEQGRTRSIKLRSTYVCCTVPRLFSLGHVPNLCENEHRTREIGVHMRKNAQNYRSRTSKFSYWSDKPFEPCDPNLLTGQRGLCCGGRGLVVWRPVLYTWLLTNTGE